MKRALIAISGGVDSCACALLTKNTIIPINIAKNNADSGDIKNNTINNPSQKRSSLSISISPIF